MSTNQDNSADDKQDKSIANVELPMSLKQSLNKIIINEDFIDFSMSKQNATTAGGSYMGDLYEVSIKGKTKTGYKEIHIFIKNLMDYDNKFTVVSVKEMYLREIFVYTELSDMCDALQNEADIPEDEKFKFVKFYDTDNPEAIIMDNLVKKDFKVFDRMEVVSLHYAERIIEELAKFHALSFVIQKRRPDYYENVLKSTKFLFYLNNDYSDFVKHLHTTASDVLISEEAKEKLKKFTENAMDKYDYYYFKGPDIKRMVLCHGDYRVSNILAQEKDGKITKVIPVDYQTVYFGNPMEDFTFFIFGATDSTFRKENLHNLKDVYHNSLKTFLHRFDIDVEDVYSRKYFEDDFKERLDFGLIIGLHLLPFILAPKDAAPDLDNEDLASITISKQDKYIKRVNDLVNDFIDWGYL